MWLEFTQIVDLFHYTSITIVYLPYIYTYTYIYIIRIYSIDSILHIFHRFYNMHTIYIYWLVVSTPLKNMSSSVGMMTFPIDGKS